MEGHLVCAAFALLVFLPFLVILAGARWMDLRKLRRELTQAFVARIATEPGFEARLLEDERTAEVTLPSGRRARVRVLERLFADADTARMVPFGRFSLALSEACPLTITKESFATLVAKAFGLTREAEVGDRAFDDKYLIETERGDRAARSLGAHQHVRDAVEHLFDASGVTRLAVTSDEAAVEPLLPLTRDADLARAVLLALDTIASAVERIKIRVATLGAERRALVERGSARCSYCHDEVRGDEPDLIACLACATILHEGCWAEHGRCPVLGCGGTRPERGDRARV